MVHPKYGEPHSSQNFAGKVDCNIIIKRMKLKGLPIIAEQDLLETPEHLSHVEKEAVSQCVQLLDLQMHVVLLMDSHNYRCLQSKSTIVKVQTMV